MDINKQKGNKIINIIKNSNSKEENDILNEYLNIALDNIKMVKYYYLSSFIFLFLLIHLLIINLFDLIKYFNN